MAVGDCSKEGRNPKVAVAITGKGLNEEGLVV